MIFIARICDVSMETIRVIYISKGIKYLAPIIAFFEIVIWLLAMEVVMKDLSNVANFLAFAFGFAMGTYIGLDYRRETLDRHGDPAYHHHRRIQ